MMREAVVSFYPLTDPVILRFLFVSSVCWSLDRRAVLMESPALCPRALVSYQLNNSNNNHITEQQQPVNIVLILQHNPNS